MSVQHALNPIRKLTATDVAVLVEAGALAEDERVELLDGVLVERVPQGPAHASRLTEVLDRLRAALPPDAVLRPQMPLDGGPSSQPEPDAAIVQGPNQRYLESHPAGGDCLLVVEVAWSSQRIDREKARLYSEMRVPEVWLVDLRAATLTVLSEPDGAGLWGRELVLRRGGQVPVPGSDAVLAVAALLP